MQALLAALVVLLAPIPRSRQQAGDLAQEDCYILNFPQESDQQLTLLDFVSLVEQATGLHFTYDSETQEELGSTKIVLPGATRVLKSRFSDYARFQLFCRGFAWGKSEPSEASPMEIRSVPSSLVRVAFPPDEVVFWFDEHEHPRPLTPVQPVGHEDAGVVVRGPRAAPGYTLVTFLSSAEAILIDPKGEVQRRWTDPEGRGSWDQVTLLRNGDLLCVDRGGEALVRLGFDGHELWRLSLPVHHEAIELADGRILVLTRSFRVIPAIDPERHSVDHRITVVSSDGRVLAEHSLYDLLQAEPRKLPVERPAGLEDLPPGYDIDPLHASSLFLLEGSAAREKNSPLRPGRVLVTLRNLDSVALVDLEEGRCVWAWGKGVLQSPHDASFLEDGTLLVLEDSDPRLGSRVLDIDPLTGDIAWQYRAAKAGALPATGRGMVQPMGSGNVLVGSSNLCEAFEVTRSGEVVWRYVNPLDDASAGHGVQRVARYQPGFIDPLLASSAKAPR